MKFLEWLKNVVGWQDKAEKQIARKIVIPAVLVLCVAIYVIRFSGMALAARWLWAAVLMLLLSVTAGYGLTGRVWGILIDDRNRMSLSRLQMALWTVLILSAFLIAALTNMDDPGTALDVAIPAELWALLGISTTSLVGSPLIKSGKKAQKLGKDEADKKDIMEKKGVTANQIVEGTLVSNKTIEAASLADLLEGEEVGAQRTLDLGKLQMLFFTLIVALAYGTALHEMFKEAALAAEPVVNEFPALTESMLALLGISHAGYLANKAVPSQPAAGS